MHTDYTVQETLCTIHALFTHCSRDLQQLYSEKNNKNWPHCTIYTLIVSRLYMQIHAFKLRKKKKKLNSNLLYFIVIL